MSAAIEQPFAAPPAPEFCSDCGEPAEEHTSCEGCKRAVPCAEDIYVVLHHDEADKIETFKVCKECSDKHSEALRSKWARENTKQFEAQLEREFAAEDAAQVAAAPEPRDDWPDPVNLFAELGAAPFRETDVPEELGAYAALYAQHTGLDPSIALVSATVAAASAIDDRIQVCASPATRWFAQARLWVLVIAPPGSGKSPAQREALAPLWAIHRQLEDAWQAETKGLKPDDPRPPRPRVVLGDATIEALSDVLRDNPRGVLVANDEFDSWIGAMDIYRSGGVGRDRGEWLRLFDGGPHSIERVKRGSVFVPNWGVSILTATTPAALKRLTRHLPEDGLIQRFIPVLAGRQQIVRNPPGRDEIEAEGARYTDTLRRLWSMAPHAHNGVAPMTFEASERFDAWRTENVELQQAFGDLEPALEAHLAKYQTLALRLALTFHCAKVAHFPDPRSRDPAAHPLQLSTLEHALTFLRRASHHALALYLGRQGSETYELSKAIARLVLTLTGEGLQRRDLLRRVRAFKDADEPRQAAALRLLVDLGWLRESDGGYTKAQPTRFALNPKLPTKFAALADQERERRATVRERIAEVTQDRRPHENA